MIIRLGKSHSKIIPSCWCTCYPLVIQHSCWKWLFVLGFPIKNSDFQQLSWQNQRVIYHIFCLAQKDHLGAICQRVCFKQPLKSYALQKRSHLVLSCSLQVKDPVLGDEFWNWFQINKKISVIYLSYHYLSNLFIYLPSYLSIDIMYVCIYIYIYMCVCVCMYIYI